MIKSCSRSLVSWALIKERIIGWVRMASYHLEKVCISRSPVLRKMLLDEGHKSRLSIHPGMTKMYKDLKATIWWTSMKADVADYVASCLVCQKAKIEH